MDDTGFSYYDENGTTPAMMTGENIGCHDDNGNMRILMADEGIFYRNDNGNVVWSTPER